MSVILVIVLLVLLCGGGGYYGYGRGYYGAPALGGILVAVLAIVLIVWVTQAVLFTPAPTLR